jgi:hypothetical protein
MRRWCEIVFSKPAVVGFMLLITKKPVPPKFDVDPVTGRETLLSLIERGQYKFKPGAYWRRVFGN